MEITMSNERSKILIQELDRASYWAQADPLVLRDLAWEAASRIKYLESGGKA